MRRILLFLLAAVVVSCSQDEGKTRSRYYKMVNPFIGTDGPGNVYPGAQVPFGMVQLSPDNGTSGWDRIAGYFWPDTTIAGFSMTHLSGTGAGDLYDVSFMPAVSPYKIGRGELGLYSTFSHNDEEAWAGYYRVHLASYNITAELTATERGGAQRYTFPRSDSALVKVDLAKFMNWDYATGSEIRVVDDRTIEGYRLSEGWSPDQRVYFVTRFSKPFNRWDLDTVLTHHKVARYDGLRNAVGRFYFTTDEGEQIRLFTAISGTSIEGARKNYEADFGAKPSFDTLRDRAETLWNTELSKIRVKGGSRDQRVAFYTALYRTMLAPFVFSDVDGSYFGADRQIHKTTGGAKKYTNFSLWDTYRAEHPLLTILAPDRVKDIVGSFLDFADQSGALPLWELWGLETDMMIGYHAVPVIVEAYLKGVPMDAERALNAMIKTANRDYYRGLGDHMKIGYVAADSHIESVSKTIEYAYDDYCIAMMATRMGKTSVAEQFTRRSRAYLDLYNKESGFFEPKDINQRFLPNFNPGEYTQHFTESNAWHYRFGVQQDIAAIRNLMGADRFEMALDSMFTVGPASTDSLPIFSTGMIGQYAHGNEPSHHVAYLYNYVRRMDKTQRYVDEIMRTQYTNTPAGLAGNEDCGQMSAWFIFSAMGFYPVDPVSLRYELGIPLFEEVAISLPNGRKFTVKAIGRSEKRFTSREIRLNGAPLSGTFITWEQIMKGGTLEFILNANSTAGN